jgi:hypothetical protein
MELTKLGNERSLQALVELSFLDSIKDGNNELKANLEAAGVEEVAGPLVVGGLRGKGWLADQLEGLVVQVVLQVAAEKDVEQHCRAFVVVSEDGGTEPRVECALNGRRGINGS